MTQGNSDLNSEVCNVRALTCFRRKANSFLLTWLRANETLSCGWFYRFCFFGLEMYTTYRTLLVQLRSRLQKARVHSETVMRYWPWPEEGSRVASGLTSVVQFCFCSMSMSMSMPFSRYEELLQKACAACGLGQSTTVQEDQCTILRLTDPFQAHIWSVISWSVWAIEHHCRVSNEELRCPGNTAH